MVGITGKKQVGKDTVANYLVKKYDFEKMAIADPMKEACRHIFLMTKDQLWGDLKDVIDHRYNTTPRRILQVIGMELFQKEIYNYIKDLEKKIPRRTLWINRFRLEYENKLLNERKKLRVVVSDIRYLHEAYVIKELGGKILRILRPSKKYDDKHISEHEMDLFKVDGELNNLGDFNFLYQQIDDFLLEIGISSNL